VEFAMNQSIVMDMVMIVLLIRKKSSSTICRHSAGECDKSEYCTGNSNICPSNEYQDENYPCSNNNDTCYEASYCYGGKCVGGKRKCPKPALENAPTIFKEYNPSGKLNLFSATVNGVSSVVVQWEANTGYKASAAHLYLGISAPTSNTPGSFPYSFTSSTQLNKFQMVVAISSIDYSATCDSSFHVSLEIDTHTENNAACGYNNNDLDYCQDSEGQSWLRDSYSFPFCCCFDSSSIYNAVGYKTIIFSEKNKNMNVKRILAEPKIDSGLVEDNDSNVVQNKNPQLEKSSGSILRYVWLLLFTIFFAI